MLRSNRIFDKKIYGINCKDRQQKLNLVNDFLEEYLQTKDENVIINSFTKHLKDIESDDEKAVKEVIASAPPKFLLIVEAKKKRGIRVELKKNVFTNLEVSEDGLFPNTIFNKK